MAVETYRGFASSDPALSLVAADQSFTLRRDGKDILTRQTPADAADGRAWGGMLAELFATLTTPVNPLLNVAV